jgi:hypothetical protein
MKKILVCGGRGYFNHRTIWNYLDKTHINHGTFFLIEGGATGADTIARNWAKSRTVPYCTVPANWNELGQAAGTIRNRWMLLLEPDLVIAFPGGPGTNDMITATWEKGIEVISVPDNWEVTNERI